MRQTGRISIGEPIRGFREWIAPALLSLLALMPSASGAAAAPTLVGTIDELVNALAASLPGEVVQLRPGEYRVERSLHVPDGVTLDGGGSDDGTVGDVSDSFAGRNAATLRTTDAFYGDIVYLGDGSALRRLRIVQAPAPDGRTEFGNGIVVESRRPGDRVTASILDCDFYSNATMGGNAHGPTGRGIALMTRSLEGQRAHSGSNLALTVERSAIRAPRGNALFVNHFAPRSSIRVEIRHSVIEGGTAVSGGTSRRELVTGSTVTFRSAYTRYMRAKNGFDRFGLMLFGASGTPLENPDSALAGGVGNRTDFESYRDRIEGFRLGVLATGHRRVADYSAPGTDNTLDLILHETSIRTEGDGAADLVLRAAASDPAQERKLRLAPGQRNVLRAGFLGVTGSGPRANLYVECDCEPDSTRPDDGNQVVIEGDLASFTRSNPTVLPPPPDATFRAAVPR